ncbi:Helix-turn-helix domain protein [Paenibacillus sp. P1XP2]|nr:Helix-turn-helix domain protein [Paenibacillus sp. P1XP2]
MNNTNVFSALAEPNRFQIVELLRRGPLTVGEISERLAIRQPQARSISAYFLKRGSSKSMRKRTAGFTVCAGSPFKRWRIG